MTNTVEHPAHYNVGKIEVIDAINEWKLDFDLGNVIKYIARAGHKDASKTVEDLKKARFYLEDAIKRRELYGIKSVSSPAIEQQFTISTTSCSSGEYEKD